MGLVFTNKNGHHLAHKTVQKHFKRCAEKTGRPDLRFHDLRHSFAVAALESGSSPKAVQHILGHSSAEFTLNVYAAFTKPMDRDSSARMDRYIREVTE